MNSDRTSSKRPVEKRLITDDEWRAAQLFTSRVSLPALTTDQIKEIRTWVLAARRRQNERPLWHNTVSAVLLTTLFAADILGVWYLPTLFLQFAQMLGLQGASMGVLYVVSGLVMACLHGWIGYSITVYSLHEGAAHDAIIYPRGPVSRALRIIANNACRLFFADPIFYHDNHALHHQKFATRDDGAFSNIVSSRRILISLLPFVHLLGISNYRIHRTDRLSKSSLVSVVLSAAYAALLMVLAVKAAGWSYALISVLVIGPWIGFSLDRLRETSEHLLMPLNYYNGARKLGVGFWAMIIGGGPWGQPCHLSHHLGADLAWYNQIGLHRKLLEMLSPEQREFFTVPSGILGYPRLVIQKWKMLIALEREIQSAPSESVSTGIQG